MSVSPPNYTQIPNIILDRYFPLMKEAELRVVLAVARKTFGWHKPSDRLSISQLMQLTGLSKQGVLNGIASGVKRGVIQREQSGQGFCYSILVNEVDHQLVNEVDHQLVNEVDHQLVNEVDHQLVNEVDPQKKVLKKVINKGSLPSDNARTDHFFEGKDNNNCRRDRRLDPAYDAICSDLENNGFGTMTDIMAKLVNELMDTYPHSWIEAAIPIAVKNGSRTLSYVAGILRNQQSEGMDGGKNHASTSRSNPNNRANTERESPNAHYNRLSQ